MKPSSPNRKIVSRAAARNAALVNQLATPGLGSLMAGKWLAGIGQLFLAVAGCLMIILYIFKLTMRAYGQVTGESEPIPQSWMGQIGAILFVASWIWALATSLSLIREARENEAPESAKPPTLS